MPKNAPSIKINNTKKYGSEVVLYDPAREVREDIANDIARTTKKTVIQPYDDLDIIAGQGTAGKEIAEDLLGKNIQPDIYLCCCGGGGLIAGTATYLKHKFPDIEIYSVEPDEFNDTQLSLRSNSITSIKKGAQTICDALLAQQPGDITFSINKQMLTDGLTVSDSEIKKTIIALAENLKVIAEPGGAVAAAALLNKKLNVENKTIIVMISGGNIDSKLFSSIAKEKNA
jgi:threonine dehydratase